MPASQQPESAIRWLALDAGGVGIIGREPSGETVVVIGWPRPTPGSSRATQEVLVASVSGGLISLPWRDVELAPADSDWVAA